MEQTPDPFAAEQTYLTEDDIKEAQRNRKGSYDEMDQDMGAAEQIDSSKFNPAKLEDKLENMFDNMQITVMGGGAYNKSEEDFEDDDQDSAEEAEGDAHF